MQDDNLLWFDSLTPWTCIPFRLIYARLQDTALSVDSCSNATTGKRWSCAHAALDWTDTISLRSGSSIESLLLSNGFSKSLLEHFGLEFLV